MRTLTFRPLPSASPLYPIHAALRSAWRAARRAWSSARERQRRGARDREDLAKLWGMSDYQLADIGLSRSDLPWMSQRDAYARLAEDVTVYNRAFGLHDGSGASASRGW